MKAKIVVWSVSIRLEESDNILFYDRYSYAVPVCSGMSLPRSSTILSMLAHASYEWALIATAPFSISTVAQITRIPPFKDGRRGGREEGRETAQLMEWLWLDSSTETAWPREAKGEGPEWNPTPSSSSSLSINGWDRFGTRREI
jgi:hypothetical protein